MNILFTAKITLIVNQIPKKMYLLVNTILACICHEM